MSQPPPLSVPIPSQLENMVLDYHPWMKDTFPPTVFLGKYPSNLISPYKSQCTLTEKKNLMDKDSYPD